MCRQSALKGSRLQAWAEALAQELQTWLHIGAQLQPSGNRTTLSTKPKSICRCWPLDNKQQTMQTTKHCFAWLIHGSEKLGQLFLESFCKPCSTAASPPHKYSRYERSSGFLGTCYLNRTAYMKKSARRGVPNRRCVHVDHMSHVAPRLPR